MRSAPQAHRQMAGYLANQFGGETKVMSQTYHDGLSVSVLVSAGREEVGGGEDAGPLSCSTLGLSDKELIAEGEAMGFGVELCGALYADETPFVALLADIAHEVQSGGWTIGLNTILPDVIAPYFPGSLLKHVLLVHPFLWDEDFGVLDLEDRRAVWLQIVPITDAEYALAEAEGVDALEDRLEAGEADISDLLRPSVI